MRALSFLLVSLFALAPIGCSGSSTPAEPPQMTPELQSQIEAEDAAVAEEERNQ